MAMSKISLGVLLNAPGDPIATLLQSYLTIPAKLDVATIPQESFKSLCVGQQGKPAHDPVAITAPKTCAKCGTIADYASLKKGRPAGDGFVVLEQTEVADARSHDALHKGKVQLTPVEAEDFFGNTAQGEKLYVVHVEPAAADQYAMLVAAVESHPELAWISQYAPRTRAGLFVARVREGVLLLEERVRHENLKALPAAQGTADPTTLGLLEKALPSLVGKFDPANYADKFAEQINALVASKQATAAGAVPQVATPVAAPPGSAGDLLSKLQALAAQSKETAAA